MNGRNGCFFDSEWASLRTSTVRNESKPESRLAVDPPSAYGPIGRSEFAEYPGAKPD